MKKHTLAALVAAGAVSGFLAMSGINLASAQESSTTTTPSTTVAPGTNDQNDRGGDPSCDHAGDGDASNTTTAPSATPAPGT